MSRTVEWVAEQAEVDEQVARDVLQEMVDAGDLITWTRERDERVFAVNEGRQLVECLRELGEETEDGILVPNEVVEDLESGFDRDEVIRAYLNGDITREEAVDKLGEEMVDDVDDARDAVEEDVRWGLEK